MKMTAAEQHQLGIVDAVIPEPADGAHTDLPGTAAAIKQVIISSLAGLDRLAPEDLLASRYARLRGIGTVIEVDVSTLRAASPSLGSRLGRLLGLPPGAPAPVLEDDELDQEGA
jgi:acetyl-CoA carboxylase carboxyl transferase subunit alpha